MVNNKNAIIGLLACVTAGATLGYFLGLRRQVKQEIPIDKKLLGHLANVVMEKGINAISHGDRDVNMAK